MYSPIFLLITDLLTDDQYQFLISRHICFMFNENTFKIFTLKHEQQYEFTGAPVNRDMGVVSLTPRKCMACELVMCLKAMYSMLHRHMTLDYCWPLRDTLTTCSFFSLVYGFK